MTPEEFNALFDRFQRTAHRLETLQTYTIDEEQERIRAFIEGRPRPERSARTNPWLRRIAETTAAGKEWERVRLIRHPMALYTRFELVGYPEAQAAGEQIRLADYAAHPGLASLEGGDFWLFDGGTSGAHAVRQYYDLEGRFLRWEPVTHPVALDELHWRYQFARRHSVSLHDFLAAEPIAG
jgi:hypothetical protein